MEKLEQFLQWSRNSRFGRKFLDILYETAVLILYLGAIALLHKISDRWLGPNAMLLGKIPVKYIIDVGHILAIGLFLLEIVKDIVEVIKQIASLARRP
jgi:hypothetical protein